MENIKSYFVFGHGSDTTDSLKSPQLSLYLKLLLAGRLTGLAITI